MPVNKTESEKVGTLSELLSDKTMLKNTSIFILLYQVTNCVFICMTVILSDFYGGMYINLCIFGALEIISSYYSSYFIQKIDGLKLVKYSMFFLFVFCMIFIIKSFHSTLPIINILLVIGVIGIKICMWGGQSFLMSIMDVFVPLRFMQVIQLNLI